MNNVQGLINLAICWAVAALVGLIAIAMLMVVGDWTLIQAIYVGAIVILVLGVLLMVTLCRPLPARRMAGDIDAAPAPRAAAPAATAPTAVATPDPQPEAAPAPAPAPAPAAEADTTDEAAPEPAPAPAAADPAPAATPASQAARPEALSEARGGVADDLKRIKGIGPKLEKLCNSLGFYHFDQIANWTEAEVAWVDENLEGFKGRVSRDNWVEQARALAAGEDTEFSKRVDKGDVY